MDRKWRDRRCLRDSGIANKHAGAARYDCGERQQAEPWVTHELSSSVAPDLPTIAPLGERVTTKFSQIFERSDVAGCMESADFFSSTPGSSLSDTERGISADAIAHFGLGLSEHGSMGERGSAVLRVWVRPRHLDGDSERSGRSRADHYPIRRLHDEQ